MIDQPETSEEAHEHGLRRIPRRHFHARTAGQREVTVERHGEYNIYHTEPPKKEETVMGLTFKYDEMTAKLVRENEQLKRSLRELRDSLKAQLDADSESWMRTLHKVQTAEVLLGIDSDTPVA